MARTRAQKSRMSVKRALRAVTDLTYATRESLRSHHVDLTGDVTVRATSLRSPAGRLVKRCCHAMGRTFLIPARLLRGMLPFSARQLAGMSFKITVPTALSSEAPVAGGRRRL